MKRLILCLLAALIATPALSQTPGQTTGQTTAELRAGFLRQAQALYEVQPDIAACHAGELSEVTRKDAIDTVNAIRSHHGLSPVAYDRISEPESMQAALIMAANGRLSHAPPADWKCHSAAGAKGAATSNLSGGVIAPNLAFSSVEQTLVNWLTDARNVRSGIGHRRWLLNPFMRSLSYGQVSADFDGVAVTHGAALKITDGKPLFDYADPVAHPYAAPRIIAWPYRDYPARWYEAGAIPSFALVIDENNAKNGAVDFSRASVWVSAGGEPAVEARILDYDKAFVGLPLTLQFDAGALVPGTRYDVTIKGVTVNGAARSFDYWFRLGADG
jgi:uncharacterized protein YkwD